MSTVDTTIHPSATSAAAQLVAARAAPHALKLYGGWFCPFVQRAWIVLEEKHLAYQYVEINPYRKDPAFLALNPRGLVPALTVPDEPRPLYESIVLCEFLVEAFADAPPRLLPPADRPYERARARLWIDHVGSRVVPAFYRVLQHTPESAYGLDEARDQLHRHLRAFAAEMLDAGAGGPWFLGEAFSLVDVSLAPWAKRLWLIDHYKPGGVGIPKAGKRGADEQVWARWEQWFEAVTQRESVRATWSEEERYIDVYKRYAENKTQSEVGQATRSGTKLP